MNISPVDQLSLAAAQSPGSVNPDAAATPAQAGAAGTANTVSAASVVQFSTLAQLLAATALFQTTQPPQDALAAAADTDFSQLAATTGQFVNAFNNFQNSVTDNLVTSFESTFDNALLTALHAGLALSGETVTRSLIDSLAQVGVNFQEAGSALNPNQFQIDWATLEGAYTANPTQTTALLSNALQALATIEQNLIYPAPVSAAAVPVMDGADALTPSAVGAAGTAVVAGTAAGANAQLAMSSAILDPLIAQEIAAYRLGETIGNTLNDTHPKAVVEVDQDVARVMPIEAIKSGAQGAAGKSVRNQSVRNTHRNTR